MAETILAPPLGATGGEPDEVEGPIVSASEIEIAAPAASVWNVLTDFERWPAWNPDVKAITSDSGEVRKGYVFRWKAGPSQITSTVVQRRRPQRIVWLGRTMCIDACRIWRLEARGECTLVHTEESYRGLVAQFFRLPLKRVLDGGLDRGLVHRKREVERRPSQGLA